MHPELDIACQRWLESIPDRAQVTRFFIGRYEDFPDADIIIPKPEKDDVEFAWFAMDGNKIYALSPLVRL